MCKNTEPNLYDVQKQVYQTQWINIRHHWDQTFAGVRYLSTLIALAIIPLKFLRVSEGGEVHLGVDPSVGVYLKAFVIVIILLMGIVTFLNQRNHYARSKQARKVVVAIERRWNLYDESNRFIFQESDTNYAYAKFAGGEKRLTHATVQFSYIIVISLAALAFVLFA